jgi:hypothetical protein
LVSETKLLLKETKALAGTWLGVQLEPRIGVQLSLSVNDRGQLQYPTARSPRNDDIMSMPNMVGHGSISFDSAWIRQMDIKRVSV